MYGNPRGLNRRLLGVTRRDLLRGGMVVAGGSFLMDRSALASHVTAAKSEASSHPSRLRCEFLPEALGIHEREPRLSWIQTGTSNGTKQTAYQVQVSTSSDGSPDLWDTGRVESSDVALCYAGTPLKAHEQAFWRVRAWTSDGKVSDWSQSARWSVGPSTETDWEGSEWIAHDDLLENTEEKMPGDPAQPSEPNFFTAPFLRKEFEVQPYVRSAFLYVSGLGYAELHLNGKRVTDTERDPGFTNYDRSVLYVTHDVTGLLHTGSNALGAILGTGWYDVHDVATWHFNTAPWRKRPRLRVALAIQYGNGVKSYVVSDSSWLTSTGPILRDGIYTGEVYDARKEIPGWSISGFDARTWTPALIVEAPGGRLKPLTCEPIRISQTITPIGITEPNPGVFIVDMGQNFSGHMQLRVKGPSGQAITMRYAEMLNDDGTLNSKPIDHFMEQTKPRQPFQQDTYISKGTGTEEVWEQRFSYAGFQYAEITGFPGAPTLDNFRGRFAHSDIEQTGSFTCSNDVVNKIQHATVWSYWSNAQSYPTDCPQREKNGWTGDAGLAVECGLMNFDSAAFYSKWLQDFAEAQRPDGGFPVLIPNGGWGNGERWPGDVCPPWDAAYPIILWSLYRHTGDHRLLARHAGNLKRYLDFFLAHRTALGLVPGLGIGEWSVWKTETPLDYVSNAYLLLDLKLISQIYAALGDTSTSQRYAKIRDEVYTGFQQRFYDAKTHFYANGSQTAQALALEFGLVPDSQCQLVFAQLAKNVEQLGRLDVGIIGARVLLRALSDGGRSDLAFLVATQTEKPGWGFWMKSGATTLWEGWNRGASLNHIMYGDVSAWFYAWIAGIQQEPDSIAFERILFRPNPVGDLREASGSYLSARGRVSSAWRLKGNIMELSLEVPCGATARLLLPARAKLESSYSIGTIDPGGTTEPRFASGHHEVRIQLLA